MRVQVRFDDKLYTVEDGSGSDYIVSMVLYVKLKNLNRYVLGVKTLDSHTLE